MFSDDRSALANSAEKLQRAIDGSYLWSKLHFHKYHDGSTCCVSNGVSKCKKGPAVMAYWRKGMQVPDDFYSLKLGTIPFEMVNFQRNLGLNISTDHKAPGYVLLADKFGYYFLPEVERIKSLAYRMQDIKHQFIPRFKRSMVMCYFCGIMNYSACLYWCRASQKDLNRLRFYYAMGVAAIVGETAIGVLGASCCKSMSVTEDNKRYRRLLEMVGLKTLREIAQTDAIATVKQVQSIRPEWFKDDDDKRSRQKTQFFGCKDTSQRKVTHAAFEKLDFPTEISALVADSGALIGDVWRLACQKIIGDFERKKLVINVKSILKYEELWLVCERVCKSEDKNSRSSTILATYHEACREYLGSDNIQERRLAHLTVSRPLKPHATCSVSAPPPWSRSRKKTSKFSCRTPPPITTDTVNPCTICGFTVNIRAPFSYRACLSCKRKVHVKCLKAQHLIPRLFKCKHIERNLDFDAAELRPKPEIPEKPIPENIRCLVCGEKCPKNNHERIDCKFENCDHGAHEKCLAVLYEINNKRLDSFNFRCDDVNFYIKPSEIEKFASKEMNLADINKILKTRGVINIKKYSPRRRRYENPDAECHHCGQTIGITETDHNQAYCTAPGLGTPVPSHDYEYIENRIRRVRKFILLDSLNPP